MDRINELLARLSELTPDELNELNELCSTTFDSLDSEPRTPANVAAMADVVAAAESARGEVANRQAAQEAAEADAEALRARMQAVTAGPEDEAGTEGDEGEGAEATGDEAEADATAPEAVAASASAGNRAARMTSVSGRGQARPSPEQVGAGGSALRPRRLERRRLLLGPAHRGLRHARRGHGRPPLPHRLGWP